MTEDDDLPEHDLEQGYGLSPLAAWAAEFGNEIIDVDEVAAEQAAAVLEEAEEMFDEDGFLKTSFVKRQEDISAFMSQSRLTGARLFVQDDIPGLLTQLLTATGPPVSMIQRDYHMDELMSMIRSAKKDEPMAKRLRGDLQSHTLQNIRDAGTALRSIPTAVVVQQIGFPAKGSRLRRVGQRCLVSTAMDSGERATLEKADRDRWIEVMVGYIVEGNLPAYVIANLSSNPRSALRGAVGKTRGSTLRLYLRMWKVFRNWLLMTFNICFPTDAVHLVDYLHVLREEPCARTVPQKFIQACSWLEGAGGILQVNRISQHPLVKKTLDFCNHELSSVAYVTWQAPRFSIIVLVALEILVGSQSYSDFIRFWGFCMLLQCWATLRFDDLQHLPPRTLRIVDGVLVGELKSTKTSGPGKRVAFLPIAVSLQASLTKISWVRIGLAIMKRIGNLDRDYLLMKSADSQGFEPCTTMARYAEASAISRLVLSMLKVPVVLADSGWVESGLRLIATILLKFWTLHTPRCVLPSMVALMNEEKRAADFLGRWSPAGSDTYVRTYKLVVTRLQEKVVTALHAGMGLTSLREGDILDTLLKYLVIKLELTGDQAEAVVNDWLQISRTVHEVWTNASPSDVPQMLIPEPIDVPIEPCIPVAVSIALVGERETNFLIVYGRKRKTAKLHKALGGCHWSCMELLDCKAVDEVDPRDYDSRCKFCWPRTGLVAGGKGEVAENSDASESDSGSSN